MIGRRGRRAEMLSNRKMCIGREVQHTCDEVWKLVVLAAGLSSRVATGSLGYRGLVVNCELGSTTLSPCHNG